MCFAMFLLCFAMSCYVFLCCCYITVTCMFATVPFRRPTLTSAVLQQETPIIFLMPCAMCAGPCAQPPCEGCNYSYCEQCHHICSATAMQSPLLEIKSETSGDTGSTSELRACHDTLPSKQFLVISLHQKSIAKGALHRCRSLR